MAEVHKLHNPLRRAAAVAGDSDAATAGMPCSRSGDNTAQDPFRSDWSASWAVMASVGNPRRVPVQLGCEAWKPGPLGCRGLMGGEHRRVLAAESLADFLGR